MARLIAVRLWLTAAAIFMALPVAAHAQVGSFSQMGQLDAPASDLPAAFMPPPTEPYFDFDEYVNEHQPTAAEMVLQDEHLYDYWDWHLLPDGLIYRSYLAGPKEPRLSANIVHNRHDSTLWNATLGARVGLVRYGTSDRFRPEGFQIDAEGAAQVRLDIPEDVDVRSVDFRGGLPITYGWGPHQIKFAYYHLSSHLGDEFLLKNTGFMRLNYARDVLVLGYSHYATENLRLYGEAGWAFFDIIAGHWEFQFGAEWAPTMPTGFHGAPFFAVNAHLRQEVNYGGGLTVQTGWAWRGEHHARLLRMGLHYHVGESTQFSFFDYNEQQIGFGVWYDF